MLSAFTGWRKPALLAALLGLAALAIEAPEAEASRRRIQGRASVQRAANVPTPPPYTASLIREVYDGEDRVVATAAGYLQYRHQPSCVISEVSGDILCAHRAGSSHSSEADQIVITRSTDRGITWTDRRDELTVFADNVNFQEIASLGQDGDRLWLVGADVNNDPLPATRVCWTSYSDDDGATWTAKSFNVPSPGSNFTTCGGGMGIYPANNGDLIFAGYWNDTAQTRYTSGIFRSTDNGVTWTVTATLAGLTGTTQYEEPNCRLLRGTSTHVCLMRIDNEPQPCTGAACGQIVVVRSTDDGATWSTPVLAFNGRGTPAWGELTNGVLVAGNRSRGNGTFDDPDEGWRGQIYYSYDDGLTWAGGAEFQSPIDGPPGPNDMRGGPYMGASFVECDTNVACVMSGQEPGLVAYAQGGLYWRYLAWNGESTPFYSNFATSEYALRYPSGGGAYLDYGTTGTLNGSTNWVATFRWRYPYTASDLTNPTGDQVVFSRHIAGQRHLDIRVGASQRLYVYTGATPTTLAYWTSASLSTQITNAPWLHVLVVYNGSGATNADRLRIYVEGVEVTAGGAFTGTIPASMTSPTTARWQVGANAGANTARGVLDDFAIWTGASAVCGPVCAERLYANGSPGDYRTSELGNPSVYLDFESSTYADLMGNWGTPAVTGSITRSQRAGAIRYGNDLTTYPGWFVSSLSAPWNTLLTTRTTDGSSPFLVVPDTTSGFTDTGVTTTYFGTPTVSGTFETTTLVSGGTLGDPAGLFSDAGATRVFDPAAGFTIHTINQSSPNTFGVRGTILALASAFDTIPDPGQFNPKGLVDLLGWVHDPTDAVASGWYWCVDTTCTALGTAAPRDNGRYAAAITTHAGSGTGDRILIDLSNRQYPRVVDSGSLTVSAATRFFEINASQGEFAVVADRTLLLEAATDTGAIIDGVLARP